MDFNYPQLRFLCDECNPMTDFDTHWSCQRSKNFMKISVPLLPEIGFLIT